MIGNVYMLVLATLVIGLESRILEIQRVGCNRVIVYIKLVFLLVFQERTILVVRVVGVLLAGNIVQ